MSGLLTIFVFTLIGTAFVAVNLSIARFLRPSLPSAEKETTYECGPLPFGDAWRQFNMHYYLIGLLFVIFDVEAVFLYPWALAFKRTGAYAVAEMVIFVGLLALGWAYAWRRGALEWQ